MVNASADVVKEAATEMRLATMTMSEATSHFYRGVMALSALDEPAVDTHGLETMETYFHMVDISFSRYRLTVERYRELTNYAEQHKEEHPHG
jgi:hypothetical protein